MGGGRWPWFVQEEGIRPGITKEDSWPHLLRLQYSFIQPRPSSVNAGITSICVYF